MWFERLNSLFQWCVGHREISGSVHIEALEQSEAEYEVQLAAESGDLRNFIVTSASVRYLPHLYSQRFRHVRNNSPPNSKMSPPSGYRRIKSMIGSASRKYGIAVMNQAASTVVLIW